MGNGNAKDEFWRGPIGNIKFHKQRMKWCKMDNVEYQKGYPKKADDLTLNDNYLFYTNQIPSKPDGDYIDNILKEWWGNYTKLEEHHGFIQWLFPIRDKGQNWESQPLQLHEAQAIIKDVAAKKRVLTAYSMMLDFYGIKLQDIYGKLQRADNWKERFEFLNRSSHNYLRITRILKSLGELGYEYMKFPFIAFIMKEVITEQTIPNAIESLHDYWIETLRQEKHRNVLINRFETMVNDLKKKKEDDANSEIKS